MNRKSQIINSVNSYLIKIPSKKNPIAIVFGVIWLIGWNSILFMMYSIAQNSSIKTGDNLFLNFILISWIIGGILALSVLLWISFGQEKIEVTRGNLKLEKTVFGIGIKKKFQIMEVKNFKFEKINEKLFANQYTFWSLGSGKIKFEYGFKTYSFGLGIDDNEAVYLAQLINSKTKEYSG